MKNDGNKGVAIFQIELGESSKEENRLSAGLKNNFFSKTILDFPIKGHIVTLIQKINLVISH